MLLIIVIRSLDFREFFLIASYLENTIYPPTTIANPDIVAQETTRSKS